MWKSSGRPPSGIIADLSVDLPRPRSMDEGFAVFCRIEPSNPRIAGQGKRSIPENT
jgi:hypothetical protein